MYNIEITTQGDEKLLYTEEIQTWTDLKEAIDFYRSLEFENINIQAYKGTEDERVYIGEFSNITPKEKETAKKNHLKLSTKIIILEILLFPVMLLKEIIKE